MEHRSHSPTQKHSKKYIDKYEQVKAFIPVLENNITRNEIEEKYGRIYQIDMMSYVAINGSIREYMMNNMPALHNFRKWRKNGFDTSWILSYFPQDFQNKIKIIAENILQTQQYILSQEFLESIGNSWEQQEIIQDTYTKKLSYDINKQEIKLEISNQNETIVTATFWFTQKTFEKIFDNIYPEYQPEYNFDKKK